jgi:polyribonucleotide 5'-hydroxyl-kinase
MSLPGLDLTQVSEERPSAAAPPSQITLSPGSEWRFEVAFGNIVRVKVRVAQLEIRRVESLSRLFCLRQTLKICTSDD